MAVAIRNRTDREVPQEVYQWDPFAPFVDQNDVYHSKSLVSRMSPQIETLINEGGHDAVYEEIIEELALDLNMALANGQIQRNPQMRSLLLVSGNDRLMRWLDFCEQRCKRRMYQLEKEHKHEGYGKPGDPMGLTPEQIQMCLYIGEKTLEAIAWKRKTNSGKFIFTAGGDVWMGGKAQ